MNDLAASVSRLANWRVVVLGDVILDEYWLGSATRLSREAPIPVLEWMEERRIVGGAANPSANIVALGSVALQVGIVGEDSAAGFLRQALAQRGIQDYLSVLPERATTHKTRILAQMGLRFPQQVARIDRITRQPISASQSQSVLGRLQEALAGAQGLLVSDYGGGLLTPELVTQARQAAQAQGIFTSADAQGGLEKYAGFDVVKCNADDAQAYLGMSLHRDADFAHAAQRLLKRLELRQAMVITRGADGATWATPQAHQHCPAPRIQDVYDTVGAGDTFIAVLSLACLAGLALAQAITLANAASGIVIQHVGNYAPQPQELRAAL